MNASDRPILAQNQASESALNLSKTSTRGARRFKQDRAADTASIFHADDPNISLGQRYIELQQRFAELKRQCNAANHRADAAELKAEAAELRADGWERIARHRLEGGAK